MAATMEKGDFLTKILAGMPTIEEALAEGAKWQVWIEALKVSVNPEDRFIFGVWETSKVVEISEPFVQGLVLRYMTETNCHASCLDRLNAEIALQTMGQTVTTKKRWRVEVPPGTQEPILWVLQYASKDIFVALDGNTAYVEAELGAFLCPAAVEVI